MAEIIADAIWIMIWSAVIVMLIMILKELRKK